MKFIDAIRAAFENQEPESFMISRNSEQYVYMNSGGDIISNWEVDDWWRTGPTLSVADYLADDWEVKSHKDQLAQDADRYAKERRDRDAEWDTGLHRNKKKVV